MYSIEVKNVSKKFRLYHDRSLTLKERLLFFNRTKYEEHIVLKDISLNIKKGKAIGLIGQNGSGKSTLLKLMTKIIYTDKGEIVTRGKVSSLLELGAGFHPDFSGRENIYTNASIFGLTKKEIDERFDKIVQFSELHEFIDNPVRTYSSGMYMRLAFSVAINVDADILLIDEILAVGDASFQKKCMDKIKELKSNGTTIVIVTHDMGAVERICDEAVWLENGEIKEKGLPRKVIDSYLLFMGEKDEKKIVENNTIKDHKPIVEDKKFTEDQEDQQKSKEETPNHWGNKFIEITDVRMTNEKKEVKHLFLYGENIEIQMDYKVNKKVEKSVFGIGIFTKDRVQCYGTNTFIERVKEIELNEKGTIIFRIKSLQLVEGSYTIDTAVHSEDDLPYDYHINRYDFNIYSNVKDIGIYRPSHEWIIQ